MNSAKDKKVAMTLGAVALVLFGPILIWPISNAGAGVLSLVLEREPATADLVGRYTYDAQWGSALLTLDRNGRFTELVKEKDGQVRQYEGTWNGYEDDNSTKVDFRPFGMVWDDDHNREINVFGMDFYQRRFGKVYAKVNDDLGEQFEKQ